MSDQAHFKTMKETGFFGKQGAGVLFQDVATHKILLVKRSNLVEQPGTWGLVGGAIDQDENVRMAVAREAMEEVSVVIDPWALKELYQFKAPGFTYHNYLLRVEMFKPVLNWEAVDFGWFDMDSLGNWETIHFGMRAILNDLAAREMLRS